MILSGLDFSAYKLSLALLGLCILLGTFVPRLSSKWPLSQGLFVMIFGGSLAALFFDIRISQIMKSLSSIEKWSELIVLVSLFACGLKIKRPFTVRNWRNPLVLILVMMPVSIFLMSWIFESFLELPLASSFLLASCLAPTDPVLASEVQSGPLEEDCESEIQFSLTGEAGLNDAFAFPFVHLALALHEKQIKSWSEVFQDHTILQHFFLNDLLLKVSVGLIAGLVIGYLLTRFFFSKAKANKHTRLLEASSSLGVILLSYGVSELLGGYGFLAVFITALTVRRLENFEELHHEMFEFTEGVELLLSMIFMVVLGALALSIGIEGQWSSAEWITALALVFLVRPLVSAISLWLNQKIFKKHHSFKTMAVISFFGIKGIGSIYYLSYALHHQEFAAHAPLIRILLLTILLSAIVHGISSRFLHKIAPIQKPKTADLA